MKESGDEMREANKAGLFRPVSFSGKGVKSDLPETQLCCDR